MTAEPKLVKLRQSTAERLRDELGIDELVERMLSYPAEMRQSQERVVAARRAAEDAKGELQLQESMLVAEIVSATDSKTNKPAFSNEAARKAELEKRKSTSEEYQAAAQRLVQAETALSAAELEAEQLRNEFSAIRHAVDMKRELFAALAS